MRTEITPGQDSDYTGYDLVMADNLPQPAVLVADRGYDSDKIREDIESRNALPMIPMRKNRKVHKAVDMTIYTLRNMVERVRLLSRTGGVHRLTQQAEKQPSVGNPIRQNRGKLPRLRRRRLHQALAPPFVNMT